MSTCADCKFYREDEELNARIPPNHPRRALMIRGSCHRYPPQGDGRRAARNGEHGSLVSSSYWCGEWVAKP